MNPVEKKTEAVVGEITLVVYFDANDCCFDPECGTCHGLMVGWNDFPAHVGQRAIGVQTSDEEEFGRFPGVVERIIPRSQPGDRQLLCVRPHPVEAEEEGERA